jgi:hypothetical protein
LQPLNTHGLPLLQSIGVPAHVALLQTSEAVQALPSSHGALLATLTQPAAASQASLVQRLPSLQSVGVPVHVPWTQPSASVHTLPSLHGALFTAWVQPLAGSHASSVQTS